MVTTLFYYLIKQLLVAGLLTGYYWGVLRDRRCHSFNRAYLLGALGLSLTLPLLRIPFSPLALFFWRGNDAIRVMAVGGHTEFLIKPAVPAWVWYTMAVWILAAAGLLVIMIGRVFEVRKLRYSGNRVNVNGFELVETQIPGTPFSFWKTLFWRAGV